MVFILVGCVRFRFRFLVDARFWACALVGFVDFVSFLSE